MNTNSFVREVNTHQQRHTDKYRILLTEIDFSEIYPLKHRLLNNVPSQIHSYRHPAVRQFTVLYKEAFAKHHKMVLWSFYVASPCLHIYFYM